jgi:tetratricopeptide (TPR) repeat protein
LSAISESAVFSSPIAIGADLRDSGDESHGLEHFRKARAIYQILSEADPQDAWLPYRLGYVDIGISDLLFKTGNTKEGLGSLRESLSIFQRLVDIHPDNGDNREGLSDSYAALGAQHRRMAAQSPLLCERWKLQHTLWPHP